MPSRFRTAPLLAAALLLAACARAPGAAGGVQYVTGRCPVPDDVRGYPVVVTAQDAALDPDWLRQFAIGVARRWQVPSRRRAQFTGYRNVSQRVVPEIPRWADDWTPTAAERAEVLVTVTRHGVTEDPEVTDASGDDLFTHSLRSFAGDPLPGSPPLPRLPAGSPDTVHLRVRFGMEAAPGDVSGTARFARQQRPARVLGALTVPGPRGGQALVKYDVDALGRAIPSTFQMLAGTSPELARAVEQALATTRFSAAQTDCKPVASTVMQSFGR